MSAERVALIPETRVQSAPMTSVIARDGAKLRAAISARHAHPPVGRALAWELAALACAVPVVAFRSSVAAWLLTPMVALWALRRWRSAGRSLALPGSPLDFPILLFFVLLPLSSLMIDDPVRATARIGSLVLGALMFVTLYDSTRDGRSLCIASSLLSLTFGGLAALCLVTVEWPHQAFVVPSVFPILGLGPDRGINANEAGAVLAFALPLPMALWSERWERGQAWAPPAAAFAVIGLAVAVVLVLTGSRGAIFSAGVGLLVTLTLQAPTWRAALVRAVFCGALLVGLVLAVLGDLPGQTEPDPRRGALSPAAERRTSWSQLLEAPDLGDTTNPKNIPLTLGSRMELWARALEMLVDQPATGVGPGQFHVVHERRYGATVPTVPVSTPHAHNLFLQAALDFGVPGMVAMGGILVSFAWSAVAVARRRAHPVATAVGAAAAGGLASFLAFGTADALAFGARGSLVLWPVMALAAAARVVHVSTPQRRGQPPLEPEDPWMARAARGQYVALTGALIVIVMLFVYGFGSSLARILHDTAAYLLDQGLFPQ